MNSSNNQSITCPNCGTSIELTDALAGPILAEARKQAQADIEAANSRAQRAESALSKERAELQTKEAEFDARVAQAAAAKRPELEKSIRDAVSVEMAADVKSKEQENEALRKSLSEAQAAQLLALKAQQAAELKAATVDLEVAKKVGQQTTEIQAEAIKAAHEAEKLNQAALQKKLDDALHQVEDMKRKIQQGSQQLQGDVAEMDLRDTLAAAFPWDDVSDVKTGAHGADILQKVKTGAESIVASILWESKNANSWGGDWIAKAKQDARREKAQSVVIVSRVRPKGVDGMDLVDEVWVVTPAEAIALAKALRAGILEAADARRAAEGRKSNAVLAYDYLTGPEFRDRLKAIGEPFRQMEGALSLERSYMTTKWNERQKLIERVREAAFGMSGDIQGILGEQVLGFEALAALPEEGPKSEEEEVA